MGSTLVPKVPTFVQKCQKYAFFDFETAEKPWKLGSFSKLTTPFLFSEKVRVKMSRPVFAKFLTSLGPSVGYLWWSANFVGKMTRFLTLISLIKFTISQLQNQVKLIFTNWQIDWLTLPFFRLSIGSRSV